MAESRSRRFFVAALLAMAAVTPLGLTAQRWMSYELLGVDGGAGAWCLAVIMLAAIGWTTALVFGVPSYAVTTLLGLTGSGRALTFCALASAATAIVHASVVTVATTTLDYAVTPALGLVFFGVFYALYYRGAGAGQPVRRREVPA